MIISYIHIHEQTSVGFWGEGKFDNLVKYARIEDQNQQQTEATYGVNFGIWAQATIV